MDNRYLKTMCNVLKENFERTTEGPRWVMPNHIVTATLNSDHVFIHVMFPDDTVIRMKCHTPMQTARICNMLLANEIVKIT